MENRDDTPIDKKSINKVRSFNSPPVGRSVHGSGKRKSFIVNQAVKSLDLAMGRLKKSKLVNGECKQPGLNLADQPASDIFIGICNSSQHFSQGIDNASLMSMNFSHYELLRNMSHCNCDSEGGSGNTCSVTQGVANTDMKDEHLERYFRSIELWSKSYRESTPSTIPIDSTDNPPSIN